MKKWCCLNVWKWPYNLWTIVSEIIADFFPSWDCVICVCMSKFVCICSTIGSMSKNPAVQSTGLNLNGFTHRFSWYCYIMWYTEHDWSGHLLSQLWVSSEVLHPQTNQNKSCGHNMVFQSNNYPRKCTVLSVIITVAHPSAVYGFSPRCFFFLPPRKICHPCFVSKVVPQTLIL